MKLIIVTVAVLATLCVVMADKNANMDSHAGWKDYKSKHGVSAFQSRAHEEKAFNNFLAVDELIEQNKKDFAAGKVTFKMAHNPTSHLDEHVKKARNGALPPRNQQSRKRSTTTYVAVSGTAPASWDWIFNTTWNPPVRDQGQCGSCWAFSSTAALENVAHSVTGQTLNASPQYYVSCETNTNGCQGGWYGYTVNLATSNNGSPTTEIYPYGAATYAGTSNGICNASESVMTSYFTPAKTMQISQGANAISDTMNALGLVAPVMTCIYAMGTFQYYESGVFTPTATEATQPCDHAVLMVGYGYDAPSGLNYIRIRNSWGASWGENGYIRIQADKVFGDMYNYNVIAVASSSSTLAPTSTAATTGAQTTKSATTAGQTTTSSVTTKSACVNQNSAICTWVMSQSIVISYLLNYSFASYCQQNTWLYSYCQHSCGSC